MDNLIDKIIIQTIYDKFDRGWDYNLRSKHENKRN